MRKIATIRVEKPSNYSQISNEPLDDVRLSLRALGLLCYMLRLPNDWSFTIEWLAKKHKDGKDSVRYCLRELEAAGYVAREQAHDGAGKFAGYDYVVRETASPSSASPTTVKPTTDCPTSVRPTLPSTNRPSTKLNNPPIVPPEGDGADGSPPEKPPDPPKRKKHRDDYKPQPDWMPERFNKFWEAYPRGESKQRAIAAWDKLRPNEELLHEMAKGLKKQLESTAWQENVGIPYAARWLKERMWVEALEGKHGTPRSGPQEDPKERLGERC